MVGLKEPRKFQPSNHSILAIAGVLAIASSTLFISSFMSIPMQTAAAQQHSQPPFMESGRPPIKGQQLPGQGETSTEATSTKGDVIVTLNIKPAGIGKPSTFSFAFADSDGNSISPIYSIELLKNNQTLPGTLREGQNSMTQLYTFNQTGIYTMKIRDMQDRSATDVINIPLQINATSAGNNTKS
jgi:hypothetical protein